MTDVPVMYLDGIKPDRYHKDADRWALIAVGPSSPSFRDQNLKLDPRLRRTHQISNVVFAVPGSRAKEAFPLVIVSPFTPGASRR